MLLMPVHVLGTMHDGHLATTTHCTNFSGIQLARPWPISLQSNTCQVGATQGDGASSSWK
jgi:hypothetical protein